MWTPNSIKKPIHHDHNKKWQFIGSDKKKVANDADKVKYPRTGIGSNVRNLLKTLKFYFKEY
jgi:hypothetical protein